ncbi:MAG: phosphodiester glycosidase family protein [Clostridiales bacterium]|nr:phosphodiester glycosidase family protein [Clostridiales bacterium]
MKKLLCIALIFCLCLSQTGLCDSALNEKCISRFKTLMMMVAGQTDPDKAAGVTVKDSQAHKTVVLYSYWNSRKVSSATFKNLKAKEISHEGNELTLRITGNYICSYKKKNDSPYKLDYTVTFVTGKNPKVKSIRLTKSGQTEELTAPDEGLKLEKIYRDRFVCYALTVKDPSRVYVGAADKKLSKGLRIGDIVKNYSAVAGVNANTFKDEGGKGNGGSPLGLIGSRGKFMNGFDKNYPMALLCKDGSLQVGVFTQQEAKELGARDAVAFGPVLIKDGKIQEFNASKTGLNPRTVIGQNAEGEIVLLVADGRHPDSPGASYGDMASLCADLGLVNALNLDGGPSSAMVVSGKRVNGTDVLSGLRYLPCAILVAPESKKPAATPAASGKPAAETDKPAPETDSAAPESDTPAEESGK